MTRAPRHSATLFIGDVTSPDEQWRVPTAESIPLGQTRNWSTSGVFVDSPMRPPIGSLLEITFVWGEDAVRTQARVARHANDGIGLQFVEPDAEFMHAVREIIEEV